jgi:hypothetical protein
MRNFRLISLFAAFLLATPVWGTRIKTSVTPVKSINTQIGGAAGSLGTADLANVSLSHAPLTTLNGGVLNAPNLNAQPGIVAPQEVAPAREAAAASQGQPQQPNELPGGKVEVPVEFRRQAGESRIGDKAQPQGEDTDAAFQRRLKSIKDRNAVGHDVAEGQTDAEALEAGARQFDGTGERARGDGVTPVGNGVSGAQSFGRAAPKDRGLKTAVQADLAGLVSDDAYASLKNFALHEEGDVERVLRDVGRGEDSAGRFYVTGMRSNSTWELYEDPPQRNPRLAEDDKWKANPGGREDGSGGIRGFLTRMDAELRQAMPGEDIELNDAQLRIAASGDPSGPARVHIDFGNYVTLTLAYEGPGTNLFKMVNGRVVEIPQNTGDISVITNLDRVAMTGRQGTIHGAPRHNTQRVTLIVRWRIPDQDAVLSKADREKTRSRIDGQWRAALAQLERQDLESAQASRRTQRKSEGGLGNWVKSWFD